MKTQSLHHRSSSFWTDNADFYATPALADRQLFLRSNRTVYCIDAMQAAGAGK